jgi:hypothetical protein
MKPLYKFFTVEEVDYPNPEGYVQLEITRHFPEGRQHKGKYLVRTEHQASLTMAISSVGGATIEVDGGHIIAYGGVFDE